MMRPNMKTELPYYVWLITMSKCLWILTQLIISLAPSRAKPCPSLNHWNVSSSDNEKVCCRKSSFPGLLNSYWEATGNESLEFFHSSCIRWAHSESSLGKLPYHLVKARNAKEENPLPVSGWKQEVGFPPPCRQYFHTSGRAAENIAGSPTPPENHSKPQVSF